ncbi:hypothetical protein ACT7CT_17860 [Bacillus sanguinis]
MDLVIEITLNNRDLKYIVIEMKVDTIAKEDQLTATYDGFHSSEDAIFILFLFGSSQICQIPKHDHFNTFCLNDIISAFNNIDSEHYIYRDWMDSLHGELRKGKTIKDLLPTLTDIKNKKFLAQERVSNTFHCILLPLQSSKIQFKKQNSLEYLQW